MSGRPTVRWILYALATLGAIAAGALVLAGLGLAVVWVFMRGTPFA